MRARRSRSRRLLVAGGTVLATVAAMVSAQTFGASGASAADCTSLRTLVYQRINPSTGATLLADSKSESDGAVAYGFSVDRGAQFRASGASSNGLVAVHRLYNASTHDFVWLASRSEIATAAGSLGYRDQGTDFFAFPSADTRSCSVPVFRFRRGGMHRFAVRPTDVSALKAAGWTSEGVFFRGAPVALPSAVSAPTTDPVIIRTSFDDFATGPMKLADYRTAMGDPTMVTGLEHTSIVAAPGRGNVVRQTLVANEFGGPTGITADPALPRSVDSASIQYDIRFDANFDWSSGGKLPGLGGSKDGTRPSTATGCNDGTGNAWSGRGMWIGPRSFSSVTGDNEWIGYMYNRFKTADCGDNVRTRKAFSAGQWHTVKQYYKLNSVTNGVANADGVHRMWLDGALVIDNTSYKYRSDSGLHINNIFWEIFRGGNDANWASSRVGYIDIDNLLVTGQ